MAEETERDFRARLAQAPNDTATRGVYADWLEEQGRLPEAIAVRSGPEAHVYRAIVRRELLQRVREVGRSHGRAAPGCAMEIESWPPLPPARLLEDARRFVTNLGGDAGAPDAERTELLRVIDAEAERRLFPGRVPEEHRDMVFLHDCTEIVVQTYLAVDGRIPVPSSPIEGVVTVQNGVVHWLSATGACAIRIEGIDAWAISELAIRAVAQPYTFDGAVDTAGSRTLTEVRVSYFDALASGARAGRLVVNEHASDRAKMSTAWIDLLDMLVRLLDLRMRPSPTWLLLLDRSRRAR